MTPENIETLKKKHPPAAPAFSGSLLFGPIQDVPQSYFDAIDEGMVDSALNKLHGSTGPSNIDG